MLPQPITYIKFGTDSDIDWWVGVYVSIKGLKGFTSPSWSFFENVWIIEQTQKKNQLLVTVLKN